MKKKTGGLAFAAAFALSAAFPAFAGEAAIFPAGIYVGGILLDGMDAEEASAAVSALAEEAAARTVRLTVGEEEAVTTAASLGASWVNGEVIGEAASYIGTGNLIERYMHEKDLERDPVYLPLVLGMDGESLAAFIQESCAQLTAEPQDASIVRVDDAFVITPEVIGESVDVQATAALLNGALQDLAAGEIETGAVLVQSLPAVTQADLEKIQDRLGTFSTDFSTSSVSRCKNLENGAAKINGRVLMPGETLSGYECLQPFTTANGYYNAGAYQNGRTVDSIGGGVCQIATTLYNAALLAEVEITQRQNHSMAVSYVKPSMDSAIAGTYKDIKITNNYDFPLYIEGYTAGKTLTFSIYGQETRPQNREIEYVSQTLSVTDPGEPQVEVDESLAPGQTKTIQSAHRGIRSQLWKVVRVDGVETERTLLNSDTYAASKAIIAVGPQAAEPADTSPGVIEANPSGADTGAETAAPAETVQVIEGVNGGPGVTAEPSAGQQPSGGILP